MRTGTRLPRLVRGLSQISRGSSKTPARPYQRRVLEPAPKQIPLPESIEALAGRIRVPNASREARERVSEDLELLVENWKQVERKNRARELEFSKLKEALPEEPRYPYDYTLLDNGKYANVLSQLDEQALKRALERLKLREDKVLDEAALLSLEKKLLKLSERIQSGGYEFSEPSLIQVPSVLDLSDYDFLEEAVIEHEDLVVAEALREVLCGIFDPTFEDTSCGDRPGYGTHAGLFQIRHSWTGVYWMIKWNLSSHFFRDMKESVLESALGTVIHDELVTAMLLDYVRKGLCTDEIRGNGLARLLRNIYLHQVDVEARKLGEYCEKDATNSSEPGERKSEFVRIRYVRTGDEILAGIAGHQSLAIGFRDDINDFLTFNLGLQGCRLPETHHIQSDSIMFNNVILYTMVHNVEEQSWRRKAKESSQRRLRSHRLLQSDRKFGVNTMLNSLTKWSLTRALVNSVSRHTGGKDEISNPRTSTDADWIPGLDHEERFRLEVDRIVNGDGTESLGGYRSDLMFMDMPKKLRGPADVAERLSDQQIFGRIDPELENLVRDNLLGFVDAMEKNVDWGKIPLEVQEAVDRARQAIFEWKNRAGDWKEDSSWEFDEELDGTEVIDERVYLAPQINFLAPVELLLEPTLEYLGMWKDGGPTGVEWMTKYEDHVIVGWFRILQDEIDKLYAPCENRYEVRRLVGVYLRVSALMTLVLKHGLKHIDEVSAMRSRTAYTRTPEGKPVRLRTVKDFTKERLFHKDVDSNAVLETLLNPLPLVDSGFYKNNIGGGKRVTSWKQQVRQALLSRPSWIESTSTELSKVPKPRPIGKKFQRWGADV
ncbi:hypothetical protein NDN08_006651 [Rhodosorus marinus]|uniref:Uncharacterized protein n=1 Tax=Rhodosorus marinus TaxID=101924 RepID=A0AAV8UJP1_9RHOD|nr:hypothetical protein NDN08_006651 [Rhodosorus marinus]